MDVLPSILSAALEAADPAVCVQRAVRWEGRTLRIPRAHTALSLSAHPPPEIVLIGAGKASVPMTAAMLRIIRQGAPSIPIRGCVVTKEGHIVAAPRDSAELRADGVDLLEAGHPVPNEAGLMAASRIKELVSSAHPSSWTFVLLSGGASALLPLPAPGVGLADLLHLTTALLASGASIDEMNAIRKHVSSISGGQLAAACSSGVLITLALSDVCGDALSVIGSGPTVADTSTFQQAHAAICKYGLQDRLPEAVMRRIAAGVAGDVAETPKSAAELCAAVTATAAATDSSSSASTSQSPIREAVVVGSNIHSLHAAARAAAAVGYTPLIVSSRLQGEAAAAAQVLAGVAVDLLKSSGGGSDSASEAEDGSQYCLGAGSRKVAVICGGETTVTLPHSCTGRGGRNQELALATALAVKRMLVAEGAWQAPAAAHWIVAALGTDGSDGPTDAAGAVASSSTVTAAAAAGLNAAAALAAHDAYSFFDALGRITTNSSSEGSSSTTVVASTEGSIAAAAAAAVGRVPVAPLPSHGGLLRTGPTGTNVMDVTVLLVER